MSAADTTCRRESCDTAPRRRGLCHSHYESWRYRQHAYGRFESVYVDATPVREHVSALRERGAGLRRIAELAGVSRAQLCALTSGRPSRGTGPSKKVHRRIAAQILAVPIPSAAHEVAAPSMNVPAVGTVRRLRALVAAGHLQVSLAAALGMSPGNFSGYITGNAQEVTARRAAEVAALFDRLQWVAGANDRARRRGAALGWPLPMEWNEDTIDDPAAEPERARWTPDSALEERREQVAKLTERGLTTAEIATQLGITKRTVERHRAAVRDRQVA